jgi:hypothetical protein
MDEHPQIRVAANQRPRDTCVIEVDVREQDVRHIVETYAKAIQSEFERIDT